MSQLRLEQYVMPAANLGPTSPLVPFSHKDTEILIHKRRPGPGLTEDDVKYIGYGYVHGCLPYFMQDGYDRSRRPRAFRVAVLENEFLKATFLLDLGGRLWSLVYKPQDRQLLHLNPVFQPANLGIRNAWFSGGVEWNFCWIGHTPLTCSPLFAARVTGDDGTPVLRMWEWERVRQMPYQIDAYLPDGSKVLYVRIRLDNRDDKTVPVYWWSNIAATERRDIRVLVPADSSYSLGKEDKVINPFPYRDGADFSYPVTSPHGGDRFYRIPKGHYPWIGSVDGAGRGFFHSSTSRLIGRKLWVFGQGAGGRRWQDFLNTPGHPYIELQGGLAQTQAECAPLPPRTEWEWLEAYGPLEGDPGVLHGKDYASAWQAAEARINEQVTFEHMERELARGRAMAHRPPEEIINRGAGWGALELRRRAKSGEESFLTPALVFDDASLTDEQAPWLELLETGRLPEAGPQEAPKSWMIQDEWRELLESSVRAGASDHWLAWLHLGIMYMGQLRYDDAHAAWAKSVAMKPSAWAYRYLAGLAATREEHDQAAGLYEQAVKLAPHHIRLALESGRALVAAGRHKEWLGVVDRLEAAIRGNGHLRLLEAQAALALDDLERACGVLSDKLELVNVREGDGGPAQLWFAYQEKRLARELGVPVDEALKTRVRKEFPPPAHLDYRLG